MYSTRMLMCAVLLISLAIPCAAATAQEPPVPQIAAKPAGVSYPFVAEVTGNNVYIRSGKGPLYYQCGKLNIGDTITVVEDADGWAKVVPPDGNYSWIHKDYVKVSPPNSTKGVVSGENVRVWAGSDLIEASRSDVMQVKLNQNKDQIDDDDFVDLFAAQPENSAYYKIKPPAGAYLWISSEFLKYKGPLVHQTPILIPPRPDVNESSPLPPSPDTGVPAFGNLPGGPTGPTAEPAVPGQETPKPEIPAAATKEAESVKKCYELSAKIDEEVKKSLQEQNYIDIRKTLEAIKADPDAGKGATHAQILLERIGRYELAISVTGLLKEQDQSLATARQEIEKAHQAQLDKLPKELDFVATGKLRPSNVYTDKTGLKRYLLMDPAGKILCYITASTPETAAKLESMIDAKVGIRGNVVSDSRTLITMISATSVETLP